jgi:hypothetical protein
MCPGRWLAYDNIWIAVASVLSVYNISAATDYKGSPIQPSVEYTSGSFRCVFSYVMLCLTDIGLEVIPSPSSVGLFLGLKLLLLLSNRQRKNRLESRVVHIFSPDIEGCSVQPMEQHFVEEFNFLVCTHLNWHEISIK